MAMLQFKHFIRFLPDSWQSRRIYRLGRVERRLTADNEKLKGKLAKSEEKGSMKEVIAVIKKMIADDKKSLKKVDMIIRQTNVLELHETQRLAMVIQRLRFLGHKLGKERVQQMIDKIRAEVNKFMELERRQMAKIDKLSETGDIYVRAVEMDEGSVVNEMMSIGKVEIPVMQKIRGIEGKIQNLADKLKSEQDAKKMENEIRELDKDINELPSLIDQETKYFDEEIKDVELFLLFVRQQMRALEAKITEYIQKGFDKALAEKLIKKVEDAFHAEINDEKEMVKDLRYIYSQAQHAQAA